MASEKERFGSTVGASDVTGQALTLVMMVAPTNVTTVGSMVVINVFFMCGKPTQRW